MAVLIMVDTRKMLRNSFSPSDIKLLKETCLASDDQKNEDRYCLAAKEVLDVLQTSAMHLSHCTSKGVFPGRQGTSGSFYYDMRQVLKYLWESIHGSDIDMRIKQQKELALIIGNKEKLGEYMRKDDAENRTADILTAVRNMFVYTVKMSSSMMVGCQNGKIAERILMEQFKEIFKVLEHEIKKLEWKDEKDAEMPTAKSAKKQNKKTHI